MGSWLFGKKGSSSSLARPKAFLPHRHGQLRLEQLESRCLMDIGGLPYLHSLPGTPTAIYLDFNGGTYGGTTYSAYDGVTTSFNAT